MQELRPGEASLRFDGRALMRNGLIAFFAMGGLGAMWLMAVDRVLDLQWGLYVPHEVGPAIGAGLVLALVGVVGMRLMLQLRQPRGARITWDENGIAEWVGDEKRTEIPWDQARARTTVVQVVNKHGKHLGSLGGFCQISTEDGRLIHLTAGVQPFWMSGWRNAVDLAPLAPWVTRLPKADPIQRSFGATALMWLTAIAGYVCLALGLMIFAVPHGVSDQQGQWAAYLIYAGTAALALRALWPLAAALKADRYRWPPRARRDWRRAHFTELGLRVLLAALALVPALASSQALGGAPFELLADPWADDQTFAVSPDGWRVHVAGGPQLRLYAPTGKGGTGWQEPVEEHDVRGMHSPAPVALGPGHRLAAFRGALPAPPQEEAKELGLALWDTSTGKVAHVPAEQAVDMKLVAFSPDGSRIVTAGKDEGIRIWDAAGPRLEGELACPAGVALLAFSPDGSRLAAAGEKSLAIWDLASRKKIGGPCDLAHTPQALAFSADGDMLAVGDDRGAIKLLEVDGQKERMELGPIEGRVTALAFLPDGRHLLSAGADQMMHFWELADGRLKERLSLRAEPVFREKHDAVVAVAFQPGATTFWAYTGHAALLKVSLPPSLGERADEAR
ncbi:MAG: hypothetical protein JXR96_00095 [Deltaproteobacteria bacterium]|nr:hypothetical protein [Deltaproteobacteria bacterium]